MASSLQTLTPTFHEDSKPFSTEIERQESEFLMQDAEGGRTVVVEQSKRFSLLKAYGKLGISMAINIGLPVAIYYILKPYLATIWALLISGVPPILMVIFTFIRTKKIDVIGVIAIVAFVLSAILALADGDARLLLLRDSVVTCVIGLMFLFSMIPIRLRSVPWQKRPEFGEYAFEMRPLVFSTGKQMFPVPPIVHPDGLEEPAMDYYWRSFAFFRRNLRIVTAIWGCGLVSEFIVKVILIEDQSVSLDQIILIGNVLVACIIVVSFIITVLVSRRNIKSVKREMEAARAY
ncbi:hypothetical protein BZG36_05323 [Bifiguratus adelaidae]|uniref:Uncharacterized protein n=1 Tax=Bifiguratus adelaidae TaxID=1938954 RepID=A0A261XUA0_9FUNG|nr:hypothetical protein BZG36_05323 [Bifiguratus adelaidae]